MSQRLIRTPAEAFAAGLAADCDHGRDPIKCPACRLTDAQISHMAVLHRPYAQAGRDQAAPHAA